MALYGEILDDSELVDPANSIKDGFTVAVKGSDKPADAKPASANAPADNQAAIDAAVAKALADKQAEIDAEKAATVTAQKAIDDQAAADVASGNSAQDLLDKAKK